MVQECGDHLSNLMMLSSRQYFILLAIANVLAIPPILYGDKAWLDNYAFRTELNIEFLLIPGIVIPLISLLTVSYRTYSVAKVNPTHSRPGNWLKRRLKGVKALALTNTNSTCDTWDFVELCNEAGIKPIPGVEIRNKDQLLC